MRIDVHNHCTPEPFVNLLLEWETSVGIESIDNQLYMVHERSGAASTGGNRIPLNDGFYDMDSRLAWMEEHDIEKTVASVSTPNPITEAFTPEQSTQLIRAINDGYAELETDYPDAFAGLGMLPLREPDEALIEVDRIANDLGLSGIALPTSINGNKLSAPELEPVFDMVDELGLTAFIHPLGNTLSDTLGPEETLLNPIVIFPTETTLQIARLIYDGFFNDHDFDIVISHMGGALLHLAGRLDKGRREIDAPEAPPTKPVVEYLQEFYYDTISFHPPALEAAIETVGIDHLVFGTDYPFDMEEFNTAVGDIEAAVPSEADRKKIMSETPRELFDF